MVTLTKQTREMPSLCVFYAITTEHAKKRDIPSTPIDPSITSLYITGINDGLPTEQHLKDYFTRFGTIQKILSVPMLQGTYVIFEDQSTAEKALQATYTSCNIQQVHLNVQWGTVKKEDNLTTTRNLLYPHLNMYEDDDYASQELPAT
jgi:hypothetical protein